MPSLSLRIDLDSGGRIGPGKIALLRAIANTGSISAAGRSLGMSYRRAWTLIEELNDCFRAPVVATQAGGKMGGGAALTALGKRILTHYDAIEAKSHKSVARHLTAIQAAIRERG